MKFFTTSAGLVRPLLATLILASLLRSFADGKALAPNMTGKAPACFDLDEQGFPQSIKINISNINSSQSNGVVVPDASKRSTSPWDYSINEDPNRFPTRIAEAKCRLAGCVNAEGNEDHNRSSVPIKQEILVIRRHYSGCRQTYRLEKQLVTVGCTCARPQITAV